MKNNNEKSGAISSEESADALSAVDKPTHWVGGKVKPKVPRPSRRIERARVQEKVISTRFPISEANRLREIADAHGLSVSSLIRQRVFGLEVRSKIDSKALNELRRQGGLLKQFIVTCLQQGVDVDKTQAEQALAEMIAAAKKLSA